MKCYLVKLTVSKFEQAIQLPCSDPDYYIYRYQICVSVCCQRLSQDGASFRILEQAYILLMSAFPV